MCFLVVNHACLIPTNALSCEKPVDFFAIRLHVIYKCHILPFPHLLRGGFMNKKIKWAVVISIVAAGLTGLVAADIYLMRLVAIGTGIEAKILASGVFVSDRVPDSVIEDDLHKVVNFIRLEVDQVNNNATATAFGLVSRTAYYRPGLGCTLLAGKTEQELREQTPASMLKTEKKAAPALWPDGDRLPDDPLSALIDMEKIEAVLDSAFDNSDNEQNTRAVVVVHNNCLIAERYSTGFTEYTPLLAYGASPLVINALTGILTHRGLLSLSDKVVHPVWSTAGDQRQQITVEHLMRMTSGLEFDDLKLPLRDTVIMLSKADMASYAAEKPLLDSPGTSWSFSNGSVNILSSVIRRVLEENGAEYLSFPKESLFDVVGMKRSVLEPDASGTFVGSTYFYATARDFARLGMLFCNDGVWNGERILPEGWVAMSTEPTLESPGGLYAALVWLHPDGGASMESLRASSLPGDAFFAIGHNGQSVTVIPSRKLVVVRLGMTKEEHNWDLEAFILDILDAIGTEMVQADSENRTQ